MASSTVVVSAYCVFSGLFFAVCAYAQLNDPDPIFWILGYVVGGPVMSALTMTFYNTPKVTYKIITSLVDPFLVGNFIVVIFWTYFMVSKVDYGQPIKDLVWSILEFEEGRELCGLLILLLHVIKMKAYLLEATSPSKQAISKSHGSDMTGVVGTILVASTLSGAVYLWIFYQPEMNERYQTAHCSGQFGSSQEM